MAGRATTGTGELRLLGRSSFFIFFSRNTLCAVCTVPGTRLYQVYQYQFIIIRLLEKEDFSSDFWLILVHLHTIPV